jgi:pyruvate dehydrogenase (quinone)
VQIDRDASRIGLRFPVEVGLVGDARHTLKALIARARVHADRAFLALAQRRKQEWNELLQRSADAVRGRLTPDRLARDLGRRLADDAIVAWDSGHNTGVLARYMNARENQMYAGSGMLATMGCGLAYAIAAALAFPGRQVVTFVGDGGLTMLLGELATVVRYDLPIKIVVMKNNTLGQIKWEQLMFLGNPEYECALQPIDFAAVAQGFGIQGLRATSAKDLESALDALFSAPGAALLEALVDPNEPLLPPKRMPKYVENLEKALNRGTPGAEDIRAALEREPAHTQLS